MKIIVLFFQLFIAIIAYPQNSSSQISQLRQDEYQISYPNQAIKIYFDYRPINGLQHIASKTELLANEQYTLVQILKDQIDQYPLAFIEQYMDSDIIPMNIHNNSEFGYNLTHQIILEVGKIKQGMSYENSVKSALAHQVAYLFAEDPLIKDMAKEIKTYLGSMHLTYFESNTNTGFSIYEEGYVSRYANGEIPGNYSTSLEFAELFAHLTCRENRQDLLEFTRKNPSSILSIKVERFNDFLENHVPGFVENNFYLSLEPSYTTPEYTDSDGEVLLNIHELRSYESIDFDAMDIEKNDYQSYADNDIYEDLPTKSWDEAEQEVEYHVFKYPYESDRNEQESQSDQKQKKRKKKKGNGLLITGAALYVLLQLLK